MSSSLGHRRKWPRNGIGGICDTPSSYGIWETLSEPRRRMNNGWTPTSSFYIIITLLVYAILPVAEAASVKFDNCIEPGILNSKSPQQLQFVPYFFMAHFDTVDPKHTLNVTIYGNVSGQSQVGPYPPPDSPRWKDDGNPFGKIVDAAGNYTTLFSTTKVLSYTAYDAKPARFCNSTISDACPWGPRFDGTASDASTLHAFSISHDYHSSYAFTTLSATFRVQSGDVNAQSLACVSASVTPDLGTKLSDAIAYIPLAILALVGIATVMAARCSPWSSSDFFYWTSNCGRDDDVLRLVTPGFGDCLQYIQFIVLAGSLSLNYPGYYQPVVSQVSWSVLMFNESFVSHGNGTQSLQDGVYIVNGTYGLSRLSQLVGMSDDEDIWAAMTIWLCVIVFSVTILCQVGFATSWFMKRLRQTPEEDLQSKNLHFTAGNVVRIMFNFFLFPIVTLSMFQLVTAGHAPAYIVAMAVALIFVVICFAAWLFRLIFTTKPRVHLFDHLPLLLLYGPLYNTYSDEAAPYAFIPFVLTFIRGIAVGAVQPSGIVQLVLLAICEVILILTLHAFRPFHNLTSMNAYHTFFAVIRLVTTLLSVAFVPSLDVSETSRGWIGYAILLLHAIVLVFGFFLNAMQTLVEVFARLAQPTADREARGGLATVFGVRQLSKRVRRHDHRKSTASEATALTESNSLGQRSRSLSASSRMILNASRSPEHRGSTNFDPSGQGEGSMVSGTSPGPSTPGGAQSPFSFILNANSAAAQGKRVALGSKLAEPTDPYYRPPRPRRHTNEARQDAEIGNDSDASLEAQQIATPAAHDSSTDIGDGRSGLHTNRKSHGGAFPRNFRDDSDPQLGDQTRSNTDYATRESDFYYGLRGPALSSMPSRRLKTGPADPMSPVASAKGWFSHMFVGKKAKDKKKGFEVVRSTPLHRLQEQEKEAPVVAREPYHDTLPVAINTSTGPGPSKIRVSDVSARGESETDYHPEDESSATHMRQLSDAPLMMGPIPTGGSLHTLSRRRSSSSCASPDILPEVPRRSSKRQPSIDKSPRQRSEVSREASSRSPHDTASTVRVSLNHDHSAGSGFNRASRALSLDAYDEGAIESGALYAQSCAMDSPPSAPFGMSDHSINTGRVKHHVAFDSLHHGFFGGSVHQGSAAELVEVDAEATSADWLKPSEA